MTQPTTTEAARAASDGLPQAVSHLLGVIEAHDLESLDCDRRGEKYCGCLANAMEAVRKLLAAPAEREGWETRLLDAAKELLEVASLRGDNSLPHPADDPKTWTGRMQDAWDELANAVDATSRPAPTPSGEAIVVGGKTCSFEKGSNSGRWYIATDHVDFSGYLWRDGTWHLDYDPESTWPTEEAARQFAISHSPATAAAAAKE